MGQGPLGAMDGGRRVLSRPKDRDEEQSMRRDERPPRSSLEQVDVEGANS
jgi:hypothetical protein